MLALRMSYTLRELRAILRPALVAAALVGTASAARAQSPAPRLLEYQATVPAAWTTRAPSSSMRLAEYVVGPAAAGGNAEVVVYFFGSGQGGTADANLARWKSQFSNPAGGPVFEQVTHDSTSVAKLTVAEYRGTYARGIGMGSAPEAARPNNTLVAVVAETPRGMLFFQLFGPQAAVESARASYLAYVKSLR